MTPRNAGSALPTLTLGALGVVYGDIGTSPLYTLREVFGVDTGVPLDSQHLIGAISVILWALMFIVTLKYVVLIMRADNHGEGGVMALTAMAAQAAGKSIQGRTALLLTGVFGAALFYGDSVITPAISVLSAVEGLEVVTPAFKSYVVPISVGVLLGLFVIQRHGTRLVGSLFGPIMLVWFILLAIAGAVQIREEPAILAALDPVSAARFLSDRGWKVFAAIGSIVLALTGAEALYADMGHFAKGPIRIAWTGLVMPSLALNYLGQGALLMHHPTALSNPFFALFPASWLPAIVLLATVATVIASQSVITGAFSMTRQAIQLGFLPRMRILYTSATEAGQIYLPLINWMLFATIIVATVGFGSSSALASAYGFAVTGTMLVTTILTFVVVRHVWRYPLAVAVAATGLFLAVDAVMVISCSLKFWKGAWFPLVVAVAIYVVMSLWKRGRELLSDRVRRIDLDLIPFIEALSCERGHRVPRTAVFATANPATVPPALLHNLKHNMVTHERNIILTVVFRDVPYVAPEDRIELTPLAKGFWQVKASFGFMDSPNVPEALRLCEPKGLQVDPMATSFFLSRDIVVPTAGPGMAQWRERMFAALARNAGSPAEFFRLPVDSVIELGTRVQI